VALCLLLSTGCSIVPWKYDYDSAIKTAVEQRRRLLVVFTAGTSADAHEMDWKVFTDAKVVEMMREFVPLRQDLYLNRSRAEELGVQTVPAFVVIRPDGTIAGTQTGKLTPEALRLFLIKYRFN